MTATAPIALITGAGKRIGRHIALHLAANGWDIAGHYHSSEEEIKTLQEEVKAKGQRFHAIKANLSEAAEVRTILPATYQALGTPDLLVNNASIFEKDDFGALEPASFDAHIAINLRAPCLLADALARVSDTRERTGRPGNIINITDQRVFNPGPDFASYTLSKMGLAAATETMAKALAPALRVNAIAPGPVLKSKHQSESDFKAEAEGTPLGHGTSPEEICAAISFILSADAMTGETIALDGGQRLAKR